MVAWARLSGLVLSADEIKRLFHLRQTEAAQVLVNLRTEHPANLDALRVRAALACARLLVPVSCLMRTPSVALASRGNRLAGGERERQRRGEEREGKREREKREGKESAS